MADPMFGFVAQLTPVGFKPQSLPDFAELNDRQPCR